MNLARSMADMRIDARNCSAIYSVLKAGGYVYEKHTKKRKATQPMEETNQNERKMTVLLYDWLLEKEEELCSKEIDRRIYTILIAMGHEFKTKFAFPRYATTESNIAELYYFYENEKQSPVAQRSMRPPKHSSVARWLSNVENRKVVLNKKQEKELHRIGGLHLYYKII